MKKTRAIILGGGISGLSIAYFLSKKTNWEVTLIEKESRLGGYLETTKEGFFFERGPRTFSTSRSSALLSLCHDLQMKDKIIAAQRSAHFRFIWHEGKLEKVPANPVQFLTSPLTRHLLLTLLKEWRKPSCLDDETIWDFVCRRGDKKTAEVLFDPLVSGIYGGDSKVLSMESCFPSLKERERSYGSITKSLLMQKRKKREKSGISSSLFSFKEGTQSLIEALRLNSSCLFHLNEEITKLQFFKEEMEVSSKNRSWRAEYLFSALPSFAIAELFKPWDEELSFQLKSIKYAPMCIVHLGYRSNVLPVNAFGYLVPRSENEAILGAVFDSKIFCEQNQNAQETRITVMIGSCVSQEEGVKRALDAMKRHLGIHALPDFVEVRMSEKAIPQFEVGHQKRIVFIQNRIKERFPNCTLLGNYLSGVSVNDCIEAAKKASERCYV